MFRSVAHILPAFGSRFASTMVSRPVSAQFATPVLMQLKQKIQFMAPTQQYQPIQEVNLDILDNVIGKEDPVSTTEMIMTSVLRKRRLKMKKHKLRKRRKAQRALRIKIGK